MFSWTHESQLFTAPRGSRDPQWSHLTLLRHSSETLEYIAMDQHVRDVQNVADSDQDDGFGLVTRRCFPLSWTADLRGPGCEKEKNHSLFQPLYSDSGHPEGNIDHVSKNTENTLITSRSMIKFWTMSNLMPNLKKNEKTQNIEKKQTDGSNINPHTIHVSNGFQPANYFQQESNPLMSLSSNAISPTLTMPSFYTSFPEEIYEPFSDMNLPNFNPSNEYLPNESYSVCSNTLSYIEPESNVSIQGNAPKNSNSSLQVSNKSYALISKDDSSEESFDTNSSSSDESDGNNAEQYPPSSSLSRPENLRILILNRAKYVSPNIENRVPRELQFLFDQKSIESASCFYFDANGDFFCVGRLEIARRPIRGTNILTYRFCSPEVDEIKAEFSNLPCAIPVISIPYVYTGIKSSLVLVAEETYLCRARDRLTKHARLITSTPVSQEQAAKMTSFLASFGYIEESHHIETFTIASKDNSHNYLESTVVFQNANRKHKSSKRKRRLDTAKPEDNTSTLGSIAEKTHRSSKGVDDSLGTPKRKQTKSATSKPLSESSLSSSSSRDPLFNSHSSPKSSETDVDFGSFLESACVASSSSLFACDFPENETISTSYSLESGIFPSNEFFDGFSFAQL